MLISSHDFRELEDVCDHVGIIHQGRIMLEKNLGDIQAVSFYLNTLITQKDQIAELIPLIKEDLRNLLDNPSTLVLVVSITVTSRNEKDTQTYHLRNYGKIAQWLANHN